MSSLTTASTVMSRRPFLALFARFEAALKRASFIRSDRREVQADWEEFGDSLLGSFAAAPGSPVADAVSYLELNPPQKQVLENGEVRWREARRLAPYSSRNAFV